LLAGGELHPAAIAGHQIKAALVANGEEADVDATLAKQREFDPDLWIIEIEDRHGRHLLDEPGLSE
ncbi:MAG: DUF1491 family protein, partial [Pseudomonadota bacterium]